MKKRLAVLDLGTNTFHLLIVEIDEQNLLELLKESDAVKLGEGGINKGYITDAAYNRGIGTIKRFAATIREYNVDQIKATGTSALRSAANGPQFVEQVKQDTGIDIKIIAGEKEAELIYEGVRHALKLPGQPSLIIDIGGGSTEFIICNNENIFWKNSYPIGAARLMDLYHHSDPISETDIYAIHHHLDKELQDLIKASEEYKPQLLIGSASAFDTFAELEVSEYKLENELLSKTSFNFNMEHFLKISDDLLKSTHQERVSERCIAEVRVDMIVVSTVLTRYILDKLGIAEMKQSAYALKEGLLYADI